MKKYYEIVFEEHYRTIEGFLDGIKLGLNSNEPYHFSDNVGIKSERRKFFLKSALLITLS